MENLQNKSLVFKTELIEYLPAIESYSNCIHRKVGSLLWDTVEQKIVSIGANKTPAPSPCIKSNCCTKHFTGLCAVIHSEIWCLTNLMLSNTKFKPENLIMVATYSPCYECSKMLQRCSIKSIYYLYKHHRTVWEYLEECNIQAIQVPEQITRNVYEAHYEELKEKYQDKV